MTDQDSVEKAGEDASSGEQPAPAEAPPPRPRTRKGLYFSVAVALLVAIAAAATAGLLWFRYVQLESALAQADNAATLTLDELGIAVDSLQDGTQVLQRADATLLESASRFTASVEELSIRHEALESRVDAFQGVSAGARRRWLVAEADHYLGIGNTELALAGHWENAISALELADDALRQLAEPAFAPVRGQISADLQTLRSADLVDVEGLSYTLGRLASRVDELPMGPAAPSNLDLQPQRLEDVESGWNRVWLSLKGAISGMINVERSEVSTSPALTAREQSLIRHQLILELQMARLGLLRGQAQAFRASVEAAGALLGRHFDDAQQPVRSAGALLDEMLQLQIEPERPDISGSLSLLRELAARDD